MKAISYEAIQLLVMLLLRTKERYCASAASMNAANHESAMRCAIWWMRHAQRALAMTRTMLALANLALFIAMWVVKWHCVGIRRLVTLTAKHPSTTLKHGDVTAPITLYDGILCAMFGTLVLTWALPLAIRATQCGHINSFFNPAINSSGCIRLPTFCAFKASNLSGSSRLRLLG